MCKRLGRTNDAFFNTRIVAEEPGREPLFRLFSDWDLTVSRQVAYEEFLPALCTVQECVKDCFPALKAGPLRMVILRRVVTRKPGVNSNDKWKMGLHMHWPDIVVKSDQALRLRELWLQRLREHHAVFAQDLGIVWDKVVDDAVYKENHISLRDPGSHKTEPCPECKREKKNQRDLERRGIFVVVETEPGSESSSSSESEAEEHTVAQRWAPVKQTRRTSNYKGNSQHGCRNEKIDVGGEYNSWGELDFASAFTQRGVSTEAQWYQLLKDASLRVLDAQTDATPGFTCSVVLPAAATQMKRMHPKRSTSEAGIVSGTRETALCPRDWRSVLIFASAAPSEAAEHTENVDWRNIISFTDRRYTSLDVADSTEAVGPVLWQALRTSAYS